MRGAAAAVLFCVCRQHGNDVRAFTFSPPPSTAGPAPGSSSPAGLRRGGAAGLGALSPPSSSLLPTASHRAFERNHDERAAARAAGPLRAAAGDDNSGKDGGGQEEEEEGEWRRFGSGRLEEDEEEQFGGVEDDVERIGLTLPEISNPFKAAFEAGQTLRSTLADTLGQITGTASPVSLVQAARARTEHRLGGLEGGEICVPCAQQVFLAGGGTTHIVRCFDRKNMRRSWWHATPTCMTERSNNTCEKACCCVWPPWCIAGCQRAWYSHPRSSPTAVSPVACPVVENPNLGDYFSTAGQVSRSYRHSRPAAAVGMPPVLMEPS